jgi:hypothetical protein
LPSILNDISSKLGSIDICARPLNRSGAVGAWNQQRHSGISLDVTQRVGPVVAAAIGHHQCLFVNADEALGRPPRGEQSFPSGRHVANAANGDLSISTRYCGAIVRRP